jgi:DNA-binding transcriptional LysR family regulator
VSALAPDWPAALQRGEIDLKLGRKYPVSGPLESQELSEEQFACVVRRAHPAPARPNIDEYAALDHVVVTPAPVTGAEPAGHIDAVLAREGRRRRIVMTVPHFLVAPFVAASSDLALTAPARLLAPFITALHLRQLKLPIKLAGYRLSQVWAARSREDQGHRWLRTVVARALASPR